MAGRCWATLALVAALCGFYSHVQGRGKFDWMGYDEFDIIDKQYRSVKEYNCRSKSKDELMMRKDVVSQLPVYNKLLSQVWYKNRSALIHLHNMALNRAFFNSYVLQRMNDSATFDKQPNWLYYYFSASADVNANPYMLNGSALYFDTNCHYPNWYTTVPFNKTLPLFGPRAFRWDDYRDQDNYLREPTRTVVKAMDAGAGRFSNYTHPGYKMNLWYNTWLPDVEGDADSLTKFTYYIGIKQSNVTGKFITEEYENYAFFGPSSPSAREEDERMLPVQWTPPYFDCGGSNKWVVSAVSPVVDYMPRYSNYTHMRRQQFVGVIVMDIYFQEIDFNACGVSKGNPGPSYLSGIDRCKKTSSCKHKSGYGFKRGGYVCVCKAGTHWPWFETPPWRGSDIEQATEKEFSEGFNCEPTDYRLALPIVDQLQSVSIEGWGSVFNSGGVNVEINEQGRKRRSTSANATDGSGEHTLHFQPSSGPSRLQALYAYNEEVNKALLDRHHGLSGSPRATGGNGTRMYTHQEVMQLVERLREVNDARVNKKPPTVLESAKEYLGLDMDDYAIRNNVDVEVEREYEEDLQNHELYKQMLSEYKGTKNGTRTQLALQESIEQVRDRHMERFHRNRNALPGRRRKRAAVFDEKAFDRMMRIVNHKSAVTASNCHLLPNHQLYLPGDVAYGFDKQFEGEGRTALRLTNFLSLYLQNVMPEENFGNLRGGGRLHVDQMYGEVLANVMGNPRIYAAGLYFDRYKFANQDGSYRELFGPWAYQRKGAYYAMDTAGLPWQYVDEDWFLRMKARFAANWNKVKLYKVRANVRSNPKGESSIRHEYFPLTYKAATYKQGFWTRPHFRCDKQVDAWVVTYVSPFFGLDELRTKLEFRGVATVDVPLDLLEINQCPQPFSVANAFKNTARCDYFSTKCAPNAGFPMTRGSYTCKCRLGFEYWHADGKEWIEGTYLEMEYEKKRRGIFSRFDHLYCRPSSGNSIMLSWLLMLGALIHFV